MIVVNLSEEDALKFVAFQKHYELFNVLETVGAFNVQYGKVIMNCAAGVVQNVVIEQIAWKR